MPRIILARDRQHEQVEFPEGMPKPESRRSGSLHLCRGVVRDVTAEELAFIKDKRPDIFKCLDQLPEPKVSALAKKRMKASGADKMKSRRALLKEKEEAESTGEKKPEPEAPKKAETEMMPEEETPKDDSGRGKKRRFRSRGD